MFSKIFVIGMLVAFTAVLSISAPATPVLAAVEQDQAMLREISAVRSTTSETIDVRGEGFSTVKKSASEGKTFLIVEVSLKFSGKEALVFFDQIALVNAKGEKVALSHFTVSFNFETMSYLPCNPAGEGSGEFSRRVDDVLMSVFAYAVERGVEGAPERWGLVYFRESESMAYFFEVDKETKYPKLAIGDLVADMPQ